jgi:hypothetical protein
MRELSSEDPNFGQEFEQLLNDAQPRDDYEAGMSDMVKKLYFRGYVESAGFLRSIANSELSCLVLWTESKAIVKHFRLHGIWYIQHNREEHTYSVTPFVSTQRQEGVASASHTRVLPVAAPRVPLTAPTIARRELPPRHPIVVMGVAGEQEAPLRTQRRRRGGRKTRRGGMSGRPDTPHAAAPTAVASEKNSQDDAAEPAESVSGAPLAPAPVGSFSWADADDE